MSDTPRTSELAKQEDKGNLLSELIRFALITLLVVLPIRIYVAQPFIVSGSSMDPTFTNGDYLIIDEISYRFAEPQRGDVVVFRYPKDKTKFFIKRVIGLPGETITLKESTVHIATPDDPQGFTLDESYIDHTTWGTVTTTLTADEYFVMGDNRPASSDSRIWGVLDRDLIIGRAFLRLLPVSAIDVFPGIHAYEATTTVAIE